VVSESNRDIQALFVLSSLGLGGSETKTVRIVNSLSSRGVRTGVAYLTSPDDLRAALDPSIPVWHLQRRGKLSFRATHALRSIIREYKPQVVLAVNLYPALYVALAGLALADCPRTVGLINTSEFTPERAWQTSFYRPVMKRLDRTVYGSDLQRSRWLSLLRYPNERTLVLYNGVDTEHFAPDTGQWQRSDERRRFGVPANAFLAGTVGRLVPEKNHVALIDAVAQLRRTGIDAWLLLVGDGRLREELEGRAARLGVRNEVIFAGSMNDVRPALHCMDVFVLPSTHVETFSNAALEAMSMCKPVILSDIGGATEMVRNGVDGFTIGRAELPSGLVPLLSQLYASEELRQRLGRAARERVLCDFSLNTMVEGYARLLDELRSESSPREGRTP
jgi:glycosyltransferase involved in cell wall biosynthesis